MGIEDEDDLIVDKADYMLDARNPNFQQDVREFLASVPMVADQDYVCFLKKLGEFCDRVRDEEAEKEKEEEQEEEEVEPWYKLWLDGVTGYKRAYVFEGVDGEGRNVHVVYEYREEVEKDKECSGRKRKRVREDSANGGDGNENLNLEKGRVGKRAIERKRNGARELGKLLREEKSGQDLNPSSELKASCKRNTEMARNVSVSLEKLVREVKSGKDLNPSSELKASCERNTEMARNVSSGSEKLAREVKSGKDLNPSLELKASYKQNTEMARNDSTSGKLLREEKSGKMDLNPSSKLKALYKHWSPAAARDSSRGSGRLSREAKCVRNLNQSSELKASCKRATTRKMNSCRGSERSSREEKSGRNLKPSAELKALCQRRGEDSGKDETYCKMLENMLVDGEDMVLPLNEDGQVRYEEDDHGEISAGCSKEPPQADTLSKPSQADISKPSDERVEKDDFGQGDLEDAHLPFRERVLNLLRKPYDQDEHTRLMELAQLQKPIVYYRELRANDVKPYTVPGHMGKSYLDHHPDLQKLLRKVEPNNGKVLKVLRGFFFWLKHLTNDGAFRPWKDEACRALMLAS